MKPKLVLVAGILPPAVFTAALGYGLNSGCGYCGQGLAVLWGIAIVIFSTLWGLRRGSRSNQDCIDRCCRCDHEYFWEEKEEVVAWHGDMPIIARVEVKRCYKFDHEEENDIQASW